MQFTHKMTAFAGDSKTRKLTNEERLRVIKSLPPVDIIQDVGKFNHSLLKLKKLPFTIPVVRKAYAKIAMDSKGQGFTWTITVTLHGKNEAESVAQWGEWGKRFVTWLTEEGYLCEITQLPLFKTGVGGFEEVYLTSN